MKRSREPLRGAPGRLSAAPGGSLRLCWRCDPGATGQPYSASSFSFGRVLQHEVAALQLQRFQRARKQRPRTAAQQTAERAPPPRSRCPRRSRAPKTTTAPMSRPSRATAALGERSTSTTAPPCPAPPRPPAPRPGLQDRAAACRRWQARDEHWPSTDRTPRIDQNGPIQHSHQDSATRIEVVPTGSPSSARPPPRRRRPRRPPPRPKRPDRGRRLSPLHGLPDGPLPAGGARVRVRVSRTAPVEPPTRRGPAPPVQPPVWRAAGRPRSLAPRAGQAPRVPGAAGSGRRATTGTPRPRRPDPRPHRPPQLGVQPHQCRPAHSLRTPRRARSRAPPTPASTTPATAAQALTMFHRGQPDPTPAATSVDGTLEIPRAGGIVVRLHGSPAGSTARR